MQPYYTWREQVERRFPVERPQPTERELEDLYNQGLNPHEAVEQLAKPEPPMDVIAYEVLISWVTWRRSLESSSKIKVPFSEIICLTCASKDRDNLDQRNDPDEPLFFGYTSQDIEDMRATWGELVVRCDRCEKLLRADQTTTTKE